MEYDQYEKAYRDARELLVLKGKNLGQPTQRAGIRYCDFEGLLLPDREIFAEAWSEEVAEAIIQERATFGHDAEWAATSCPSCAECERLFLVYSTTNETYLDILRVRAETKTFRIWLDGEIINSNRRKRDVARQSLGDHQRAHRGLAAAASLANADAANLGRKLALDGQVSRITQ